MKKTNSTTAQPEDAQAPAWSFWLWLAAAFSVVLIVAVLFTAWAVARASTVGHIHLSDTQTRIILAVSQFPVQVRTAVQELKSDISGDPLPLLFDRKSIEQPSWVRRFPAPEDSGYLLFSGVDPSAKHSVVKLIRISDGMPVARWDPNWQAIYKKITPKKYAPDGNPNVAMAVHPVLLADGDIIFNTSSSLVRMSPCSPQPVWVLDEVMHHSNEIDESGGAIWVSSVSQDGFTDNPWIRDRIRDDSLARVSTDGHVLENRSFARILRDNGLRGFLLPGGLVEDPIHINQIKVAYQDSSHWKRGDLLISAASPSTVFLYRPSTGRILWYQPGPWLHQHSVDFVDNHRISVFDNNTVGGAPTEHNFMAPGTTNHVFIYNFDTKQTTEPFAVLLDKARPATITQGRARVLSDGGLFVEETDYGRHLRFTKDRLLWSRINDYDKQHIGAVSWSRYLMPEEVSVQLHALSNRRCEAGK